MSELLATALAIGIVGWILFLLLIFKNIFWGD